MPDSSVAMCFFDIDLDTMSKIQKCASKSEISPEQAILLFVTQGVINLEDCLAKNERGEILVS